MFSPSLGQNREEEAKGKTASSVMWKFVDFGENSKQLEWQVRVRFASREILLGVDAASKAKGKQTISARMAITVRIAAIFRLRARGEK